MGDFDIDSVIKQLLAVRSKPVGTQVNLPEATVRQLCLKSREIFITQPILLELEAPIKICGDIHGQYFDMLRLFDYGGYPPEANYLFLGDYVDRGKQSVETICLLLAYKIKYPENFFVLRGNHECYSINKIYGFYEECKRRYNIKLWKTFTDCFNTLPIAAIIDDKIFCTHGGLSPDLNSLEQIRIIRRPTDVPDTGLLCDLLWSDPDRDIVGWGENDRGVSFTFGANIVHKFLENHDMDLICRAHQVVQEGYEFFAKRRLVTIFSAPNYCVAEKTPVTLASGGSIAIEKIPRTSVLSVGGNFEKAGAIPAEAEAGNCIYMGYKQCLRLALADGRDLVLTPDHRVLVRELTEGHLGLPFWKEAGEISVDCDRVVVAPKTISEEKDGGVIQVPGYKTLKGEKARACAGLAGLYFGSRASETEIQIPCGCDVTSLDKDLRLVLGLTETEETVAEYDRMNESVINRGDNLEKATLRLPALRELSISMLSTLSVSDVSKWPVDKRRRFVAAWLGHNGHVSSVRKLLWRISTSDFKTSCKVEFTIVEKQLPSELGDAREKVVNSISGACKLLSQFGVIAKTRVSRSSVCISMGICSLRMLLDTVGVRYNSILLRDLLTLDYALRQAKSGAEPAVLSDRIVEMRRSFSTGRHGQLYALPLDFVDTRPRICRVYDVNVNTGAGDEGGPAPAHAFFSNGICTHNCGEFDNAGAMMSVDRTLMCSFQILRPQERKDSRPAKKLRNTKI